MSMRQCNGIGDMKILEISNNVASEKTTKTLKNGKLQWKFYKVGIYVPGALIYILRFNEAR